MINLRLIRLIIIQCWTARIMKLIFRTLQKRSHIGYGGCNTMTTRVQ